MWLSSSPDINEAVSLLLLELLDTCNHFVVQPVSIRSPDNQTHKVLHKLATYGVTKIIFRGKVLIQCLQIGIQALADQCIQYEGRHPTCKQQSRSSWFSSQELEQDPCLLVTAKEMKMISVVVVVGDCKRDEMRMISVVV